MNCSWTHHKETQVRLYHPELVKLQWLPIQQRIDFKAIILMFKAIYQQAPHYIIDILQVGAERRLLRSNSSCSPYFVVPRTSHITFADRAFSVYGPKLWNKLPDHIRDTTSFNTFKALLKAHLFQEAYHQWLFISSVPQRLWANFWFRRYTNYCLIDWLIYHYKQHPEPGTSESAR